MAKSNRPKISDEEKEFDRRVAAARAKLHQSKTQEEYAEQIKKIFGLTKQKDLLAIAVWLAEAFDDPL